MGGAEAPRRNVEGGSAGGTVGFQGKKGEVLRPAPPGQHTADTQYPENPWGMGRNQACQGGEKKRHAQTLRRAECAPSRGAGQEEDHRRRRGKSEHGDGALSPERLGGKGG